VTAIRGGAREADGDKKIPILGKSTFLPVSFLDSTLHDFRRGAISPAERFRCARKREANSARAGVKRNGPYFAAKRHAGRLTKKRKERKT